MKSNIVAIVLLVLICSCSSSKRTSNSNKQITPEIALSLDQTTQIITSLAGDDTEGRKTATPGFDKAADYTINFLKEADWIPFFDQYKVQYNYMDTIAYNVVAVNHKYDPNQPTYILSAHLDHLGFKNAEMEDNIWNGANDNASGVTAVMQIANALRLDKSIKQNIIVALFSGEEDGLVGSTQLAKQMDEAGYKPQVQFNFEMIGAMLTDQPNTVYLTGYNLSNMSTVLNEEAGRTLVVFFEKAKQLALFKRSDNYPFYEEFNIPAQTFSSFDFKNYNYYHDTDDEIEQLDLQNMNNIINSMYKAIYGVLINRDEITLTES